MTSVSSNMPKSHKSTNRCLVEPPKEIFCDIGYSAQFFTTLCTENYCLCALHKHENRLQKMPIVVLALAHLAGVQNRWNKVSHSGNWTRDHIFKEVVGKSPTLTTLNTPSQAWMLTTLETIPAHNIFLQIFKGNLSKTLCKDVPELLNSVDLKSLIHRLLISSQNQIVLAA